MHRLKTPAAAGLAVLALVAVLAAGCGGSSKKAATTTTSATTTSTTISTPATDSTIAAQVPAKFKSKTLTVATDATYAPNEFIGSNGTSIEGMDPDLGKALGAVMGVKVKFVNTSFDGIIPGLASGKFDLGMASFTDTKERQKVVDFVTYFEAGTSFYVKAAGVDRMILV
jgi:polar amino acid transport system substrate-binding protein